MIMITMTSGGFALRNTKSVWFTGMILTVLLLPALRAQERIPEPSELRRSDRIRTIAVTGNAEASAPPDQAVVRLGTTVQMAQADAAQAKVNEAMQRALDGIEKIGVSRRSIRTATLTLTSVYSNERLSASGPETPRVIGFRANNTLEITLEDTKLVGKVIDAGIAAGANELQGVAFSLKNDLPQRTTALAAAAEEAKTKAQTIASALNVQLGPVVEVTEAGVHAIPFNEGFVGGRMMSAGAVRTPIEPGEVRVQANVTVRYEIGPSHP